MKSWEALLIAPETTLADAIATLDAGGMQIVIVVDAERRILGTLTDGDVRRALIRRLALSTPVRDVMYTRPQTAPADATREHVLSLMENHRLLQIPLVDAQRRVTGLETLHGLLKKRQKGNLVFLMAGGLGSRLQPLTDTCPKPLLKVGNKPILELIVENFAKAGFRRFFISTCYMGEMIHEHFGDGKKWGVSIDYIHEAEPLGTAGALALLPRDEIDQPIFMMNGDLLTNLNFERLLEFHQERRGVATMCVREYQHRVPYGVVESEGDRIRSMVEKPVHRYFVNAGIYVLGAELVKSISAPTRIDMPTLLEQQIAAGREVNMFPVHEYWLDIGRMEDFQRAQFEVGGIFHV
jgi:dTDP-glucose pyrophosphorylase